MRVCIAAGGTGGHLYPGIALAEELLRQSEKSQVEFVGTRRGLEARVLPNTGFRLSCIAVRGVMGASPLMALMAIVQLPIAIMQCIFLLRRKRSELVIGIGGYSSPPLILAAFCLGIPRVIVEPNIIPGMANRLASKVADLALLAFGETKRAFQSVPTKVVGVPLRKEFESVPIQTSSGGPASGQETILILGGSQGSRAINRAVIRALSILGDRCSGIHIIHQAGEADYIFVRHLYAEMDIDAVVVASLNDVRKAYADANFVICRSGAGTIAELAACGKASILIPFPSSSKHHQLRNAEFMSNAGASILIEEACLTGEVLASAISGLLDDRAALMEMEEHSLFLSKRDATSQSIKFCKELITPKTSLVS